MDSEHHDNYYSSFLAHVRNPNTSYKRVLSRLIHNGQKVAPRGLGTREILHFMHVIERPLMRLCTVPGRKANPFFNMAENMWILSGRGDSAWITSFNSKLAEYQLDEGHTDFAAPYGRRIRQFNRHRDGQKEISVNKYTTHTLGNLPKVDQLHHCWEVLRADKYSRQAVVTLWNPVFDYHLQKTKDRPCNTTIYFVIRTDDKGVDRLHMTVSNRSNDIHLGLYGVNFVQFTHIQEFMAASLRVEVGTYTHLSNSLHAYDSSQHTEAILNSGYDFDVYDFVPEKKGLRYEDVASSLDSGNPGEPNLGDFLKISDEVISESALFRDMNSDEVMKFEEYAKAANETGGRPEMWTLSDYTFRYCRTKYARCCAAYLFAYDLQKAGFHAAAFGMLSMLVHDSSYREFDDWYVAGLEFFCRKKDFVAAVTHRSFKGDIAELARHAAMVACASNVPTDSQVENMKRFLTSH